MTDEYSEYGASIHRYNDKENDQPGWTPPIMVVSSTEAIEELFEKNQITEVLNPNRPSLSQSPWWKIW